MNKKPAKSTGTNTEKGDPGPSGPRTGRSRQTGKNPPPTLEDVAQQANVSTATISRALNEPHKVATSTREHILDIIDKVGYTPNHGARVLASRRNCTVGAIIPTMENAMFASGLQAFQQELSESGYTLLVASSGYDANSEYRQIQTLVANGADGLLLIGASRPAQTEQFLQKRNIPCVISWSTPCKQQQHAATSNSRLVYAGFDNAKAAALITHEVLAHGHRNIAMIAGIGAGNDRARKRAQGVRRAISTYGNGARLLQLEEADYSLNAGGDAFERLITDKSCPTAVICGNDVLAAGAIIRARELDIQVPQQMSITGFDDIPLATALSPRLTTIQVPQEEMGRAAAKLLLQFLDSDTEPQSIEFNTKIIHRDSLVKHQLG